MRIIIRSLILTVILCSSYGLGVVSVPRLHAAQPDYAKWGLIAMQQTSAKYHSSIIDYEHIGRSNVRAGVAEEKFKLWLRDNEREFGVIVTIQFYTANDQIITITYEETDRSHS